MDGILNTILIIALIPAVLFCYAQFSNLIQLICNHNFDEPRFKQKWQLNSYASYFSILTGVVNFVNVISIQNMKLDFCINVALVIGSYWYLVMLIKNYFSKETT